MSGRLKKVFNANVSISVCVDVFADHRISGDINKRIMADNADEACELVKTRIIRNLKATVRVDGITVVEV